MKPAILDAISLLFTIVVKCPETYQRNEQQYRYIIEKQSDILDIVNTPMSANIDKISLQIALSLLLASMGDDGYIDFMEGMAYVHDDVTTLIYITQTIINFLELGNDIVLPHIIETVVLQNVLQWLYFDNIDVKFNATRILLFLIRNPENESLINQKVINLIDSESLYIKNYILRQLLNINNISVKTQEYVMTKCQHDSCYVVRLVCSEVQNLLEARKS